MNSANTLWMGEIDPWIDELFILNSFKKYGFKPKSVKLIVDKRINRIQNFCLINFETLEEAKKALFKLNGKPIPETNIFFKLNLIKNEENYYNVYVGNLPLNVDDNKLYELFKSKYPSIYYASIINDKGLSKGYGFVHFKNEEEYYKCLKEMDGIFLNNRKIKVKRKNKNWIQIKKFDYFNIINSTPLNINNEESSSLKEEEEKKQDSSMSGFYSNDLNIMDNIELIKSNNNIKLYQKIEESVNKIIESYKGNNKTGEISPMVLYYGSINKGCFDD